MNRMTLGVVLGLALGVCALGVTPRTLVANFDGENEDKVYTVVSPVGIGTTFKLPEGARIQDFVVSDSKLFFGQSNGAIAVVKALAENKETTAVVHTDSGATYVFLVSSAPAAAADTLVVIEAHDKNLFRQTVAGEVRRQTENLERNHQAELEKQLEAQRLQLLAKVQNNYRIQGDAFPVERVADDGVFTYIFMPRAQVKPAVYLLGRGAKKDQLEPLAYTDQGSYYRVNHVLSPADDKLVLKLEKQTVEITREGR